MRGPERFPRRIQLFAKGGDQLRIEIGRAPDGQTGFFGQEGGSFFAKGEGGECGRM